MTLAPKTLTLQNISQKSHYVDSVWSLLKAGYQNVKGGLFFSSKEELINTTAQWKVIVINHTVIAVSIYKAKKGLKLVAMTACKAKEYKKIAVSALAKLIKKDLKTCWMELSESAEKFVMRFAKEYVLKNTVAAKILDKEITLSEDGVHYYRTIKNIRKEKVIIGTPTI